HLVGKQRPARGRWSDLRTVRMPQGVVASSANNALHVGRACVHPPCSPTTAEAVPSSDAWLTALRPLLSCRHHTVASMSRSAELPGRAIVIGRRVQGALAVSVRLR